MEEFVTFDVAVKLKDKGFREECSNYYAHYPGWHQLRINKVETYFAREVKSDEFLDMHNRFENGYIDAPTISQALTWLRNKHRIHIEPCILADCDSINSKKYTYWSFSIVSIDSGDMIYFEYEHIDDKRFDSYEQAVNAGIEYALDNIVFNTYIV